MNRPIPAWLMKIGVILALFLPILVGCAVKQPPPMERAPEVRKEPVPIPPPEEAEVPDRPLPYRWEFPEEEEWVSRPVPEQADHGYSTDEAISPPSREESPADQAPPDMEASLPPELYRQEAIRVEPFITRGLMAELIAALPDLPRGENRVLIMTDILDHKARESIIKVVGSGYMDVFPNHEFKPEAFISRAEMADILWRLASSAPGLGEKPSGGPPISDLPATNRYYEPVKGAVDLGLFTLEKDGTFGPTRLVSGSEAWETMIRLYRLLTVSYG